MKVFLSINFPLSVLFLSIVAFPEPSSLQARSKPTENTIDSSRKIISGITARSSLTSFVEKRASRLSSQQKIDCNGELYHEAGIMKKVAAYCKRTRDADNTPKPSRLKNAALRFMNRAFVKYTGPPELFPQYNDLIMRKITIKIHSKQMLQRMRNSIVNRRFKDYKDYTVLDAKRCIIVGNVRQSKAGWTMCKHYNFELDHHGNPSPVAQPGVLEQNNEAPPPPPYSPPSDGEHSFSFRPRVNDGGST